MRKGFLAAVGTLVLGGTAAFGQSPYHQENGTPLPPAPALAATPAASDHAPNPDLSGRGCEAGACNSPGSVTLSADYLLWWVRKGPGTGPLLTTGSPSDAIPGALGQAGTAVIFGDGNFEYHGISGLRLNGGVGLGSGLGLDASYFVLNRASTGITAASDFGGNPLITRPFINDHNGLAESYTTSFPGSVVGATSIVTHTQLQGYEINLALTSWRDCGGPEFLVGYRYLNLREDLGFHDSLTPLVSDFLTFEGATVNPPSRIADFDAFRTSNHFYGGQVGARWQRSVGPLELGVLAKLALGVTDQRVQVDGASALITPGAATTVVPGGIYAQTTNLGSHSHNEFSVVPEFGINLGWHITPSLTAIVGYTFLYWTDVARPGPQIDQRVSPFLVPTDQDFGKAPGSGRPTLILRSSDFWAQGLNVGLTLRF